MDIKNLKFHNIYNNFINIMNEKKFFLDNFSFLKEKIDLLLYDNDIDKNVFGIFLVQELDESKQILFLKPLVDIFIYNIGIKHRVYRILISLNENILLNDMKDIVCSKKYAVDYIEVGVILNFYKKIDLNTALFFCNFFRDVNDEDINETIDDFLLSLS